MRGTAAGWWTVGPDGTGSLEVRAVIETDDDALVLLTYQGRRDFSQGGDPPTYAAPRFETGDQRYGWLNKVQAVSKGTQRGQR